MKKRFTLHFLATIAAALLLLPATAQEPCGDFAAYFVNIPTDDPANTTLYRIDLENDPTIQSEFLIGRPAHIALSPDGSVYVVTVTGKVAVYNPSTGTISDYLWIHHEGAVVQNTPQAAVNPATGELYVGSADNNAVYVVDPATGAATHYTDVELSGGDLFFDADGDLWTVNRYNDEFLNLNTGESFNPGLANVNGAGWMPDGTIIVANSNDTFLQFVDPATGTLTGEELEIGLTIGNGDIATGCLTSQSFEGCYAAEVVEFVQGTQTNGSPVAAERSDPNTALGEPDRSNATGGFVSLGVGGHITLAFNGAVFDGPGNDIKVWETSYSGDDCGNGDDEYADVEVSQDGINYYLAGSICRDGEVDISTTGLNYILYVRISNSAATSTPDGYDVDGVEALNGCGPIPLIGGGDCYATEIVSYTEGTQLSGSPIAANRTDPNQALGDPERTDSNVFTSLGYGGSLILGFDGYVYNGPGDDLEIVETTFNQPDGCNDYPEFADVYVSLDGITWDFAKTVCKEDNFVDISDAGDYSFVMYVKLVNNDDLSTTPDGFDVDGVVALHNCPEIDGDSVPFGSHNPVLAVANLSAYPNPTEGDILITFDVLDDVRSTLEVFDMSGRNIGTLFSEVALGGQEYRVPFDAHDLPSGVYVYKLTTPDGVIVEKFVVR